MRMERKKKKEAANTAVELKKRLREKTNSEICHENGLKYSFLTNIIEEDVTQRKIEATLEIISKTLCGTLGPYGSTTIIQARDHNHIISKDGYDLCNRLDFQDPVSQTVLDIIRNVASNQVQSVGDGSTSAIVVAASLYKALKDIRKTEQFKRLAPKDVTEMLKIIADEIEALLKQKAVPLSEDLHELDTIATISTNNDAVTGKMIADIYRKIGKFGFVSTEVLKKTASDQYEIKHGIEWKRGAIDRCFINNPEKKTVYDENVYVFITNSELTFNDLNPMLKELLGKVCGNYGGQLLLIANSFDADVMNFLKLNKTKHLQAKGPELQFLAVDIDNITKISNNTIEDIALLANCEVFDKIKHNADMFTVKPERFLGRIEKAIVSENTTQIIGQAYTGDHKKIIDKHVTVYTKRLEELMKIEVPTFEDDGEIYELKKRLAELTDSTVIINVGGDSLTERMSRERLIEDAIFACKSAMEHGYIPGGNIMIPRILQHEDQVLINTLKYKMPHIQDSDVVFKKFINIVQNAFLESYYNVLNNSYLTESEIDTIVCNAIKPSNMADALFFNLKTHKSEPLNKTSVINSLKTDIEILNSTVSIIGILAVSNQMIAAGFSGNLED